MERSSGAAPPPPHWRNGHGSGPLLEIHIEDLPDGASRVAIVGELDLSTISRIEGPLLEQVEQRQAVLVDLSNLSFIDSSGIGTLIRASRSANGTPLRFLVSSGSHVHRVFAVAGINDALPVFSDRELALAALADRDGAG